MRKVLYVVIFNLELIIYVLCKTIFYSLIDQENEIFVTKQ